MFFDLMVSYALALVLTLLFVFSPRRRELPEGASVGFFLLLFLIVWAFLFLSVRLF